MSTPDPQQAVADLISATEIREVRLAGIAAEVHDVPTEMTVDFKAGQVEVGKSPSEIVAKFEHSAKFTNADGETVATISLVHAARFSYDGDDELNDELVGNWVFGNVYFMVYPYVRHELQDACVRLGLPGVVLGYLKRGEIVPENISLIVATTSLAQKRGDDPLPLEPQS
ncbi:hypothetical protein ACMYYO_00965 [Dermacoccaceae bacterium W4C1]